MSIFIFAILAILSLLIGALLPSIQRAVPIFLILAGLALVYFTFIKKPDTDTSLFGRVRNIISNLRYI